MALNREEEEFMEMYHQRMSDIQNVSDFIAIANTQLHKVLQKIGWNKATLIKQKSSKLQQCPINRHHRVTEDNKLKHTMNCHLKKIQISSITEKDLCADPTFAYEDSSVVPVFINSKLYTDSGVVMKSGTKSKNPQQNEPLNITLLERNRAINEYVACDPLDELRLDLSTRDDPQRFIYSWQNIPKRYFTINDQQIPAMASIKQWLIDNMEPIKNISCGRNALINSILSWLNKPLSADQLLMNLDNMLSGESRAFVLKLWKFISAKSLCIQQHIPEHTRNEFDHYSIPTNPKEKSLYLPMPNNFPSNYPFLPMEWIHYNLTSQQKLKVYEHTIQVSKLLSQPSLKFTDLAAEAVEQMNVLAALNAEKSGQKTQLEIMAEMRDYKRRRQSYRGKNKANRKMTGLEEKGTSQDVDVEIQVLREVVEQQMLYFKILQGKQTKSLTALTTNDLTTTTASIKQEEQGSTTHSSGSNSRSSSRVRKRSKSSERRRSKSRERHRSRSRERNRSKSRERHNRSRDSSSDRRKSREYGRDRSRSRSRSRDRYSSRRDDGYRSRRSSRERRSGGYKKERIDHAKNEVSNITYY